MCVCIGLCLVTEASVQASHRIIFSGNKDAELDSVDHESNQWQLPQRGNAMRAPDVN